MACVLLLASGGMPNAPSKLHSVTVVADSRETIDGLHSYLQGAGVTSHTARVLGDATAIRPKTTALVVFPDEFDPNDVVRRLSALRAGRPRLLVVVVTSTPQRFRSALEPDGHSLLPIVLPKPAFGWAILDAIRARAAAETR